MTAYGTGMRRCEAIALRVDQLDSQAGLIRIDRGKGGR